MVTLLGLEASLVILLQASVHRRNQSIKRGAADAQSFAYLGYWHRPAPMQRQRRLRLLAYQYRLTAPYPPDALALTEALSDLQAECERSQTEVAELLAGTLPLWEDNPLVGLTERQRKVAKLAAAGLGTKEIASRLFISEHTVKDHLRAIRNRLGVLDRRASPSICAGRSPHRPDPQSLLGLIALSYVISRTALPLKEKVRHFKDINPLTPRKIHDILP